MSIADAVAALMFAAVVLYSVLGGADFGSGVWDLTAGDDGRGARTRRLVDHAIGPVWEANHVWLIFVLVVLWTGFPVPFAAMMRTLGVPFWLAGLGIVLRGAGFAFRKYAPTVHAARLAGATFAVSSLLTPFVLGAIAGAVASGRVPADGSAGVWEAWTGPTSIYGGVLAVATCTLLAGVFLAAEAESLGDHALADALRRKSLLGGMATGGLTLAGIPIILADSPTLAERLLGRALPLVILSAVAGALTLGLLATRRVRVARFTVAIAVAAVVLGWGVAQYPWLLVDEVTIEDGAGVDTTLWATLVAGIVALVVVTPPLYWLFRLADTNQVGVEKPGPEIEAELRG